MGRLFVYGEGGRISTFWMVSTIPKRYSFVVYREASNVHHDIAMKILISAGMNVHFRWFWKVMIMPCLRACSATIKLAMEPMRIRFPANVLVRESRYANVVSPSGQSAIKSITAGTLLTILLKITPAVAINAG